MKFRKANPDDLPELKRLACKSWGKFREELTPANWEKLEESLLDDGTYTSLLQRHMGSCV